MNNYMVYCPTNRVDGKRYIGTHLIDNGLTIIRIYRIIGMYQASNVI